MGKKKKIKKRIGSRLPDGEHALVICVGKDCAPRDESRALVQWAREYVRDIEAQTGQSAGLQVHVYGCLGVCKKGPIAATLPPVSLHKRVDEAKAQKLIDHFVQLKTRPRRYANNDDA